MDSRSSLANKARPQHRSEARAGERRYDARHVLALFGGCGWRPLLACFNFGPADGPVLNIFPDRALLPIDLPSVHYLEAAQKISRTVSRWPGYAQSKPPGRLGFAPGYGFRRERDARSDGNRILSSYRR